MRIRLFLLVATLLIAGGCSSGHSKAGTNTISVVATTSQLADFVNNVGGDFVSVRTVMKPGVDPHEFEATPGDVRAMHDADLIVRNGVGLESWFDATLKSSETKAQIVDASLGVVIHNNDPHIWQSPKNAQVMVNNVAEGLKRAAPQHAAAIDVNSTAYKARLDTLDSDIAAQVSSLSNKQVVTDHDAFDYYLDRYGLVHAGSVIPSFDSQAELSSADINALVAKIQSAGVKAIFVEQSVSPKTAATIAREAKVKVISGEGSLFGDTLAPKGDAATYIGAMRHNTKVLVDNLR